MSISRPALTTGVLAVSLLLAGCTRFFDPPVAATQPASPTPLAATLRPTATIPPVVLAPEGRRATVSEVVNKVEAEIFAEGAFEAVQDGTVIGPGGQVRTADASRARVDLGASTIVRLDANTVFGLEAMTDSNGSPLNLISLNQGRIWVTVSQGSLQVITPIGIASVRGSFASLAFSPGDPNDLADDTLTLDCIEGVCALQTKVGDVTAGNLERMVLVNGAAEVKHTPLGTADVQDFVKNNPDPSQAVIVALTAQSGSNPTPTVLPQTAQPTASGPTAVPILGKHVVRSGESLFCIGRAYGVLPGAIAEANGLDLASRINPNQELVIPAVRWLNIPGGPVCVQQFNSPFPAGEIAPTQPPVFFPTQVFNQPQDTPAPTEPPTEPPPPTLTPTPACPPPQLYDPVMDRCRILQP